MPPFLLLLPMLVPMLVLLAAVRWDRWKSKQRGDRPPISEKLLRPAGYSLQSKLNDLNESFDQWNLAAFLCSLCAVGSFTVTPNDWTGKVCFLLFFGLTTSVCTVIAYRKLCQIRNYRGGLLGEQAIAEQLQELLGLRYQIFHDVPGDGPWNIDHVAVGPGGVFAIETKYRTKRPGKEAMPAHEAIFDGNAIVFPSGTDTNAPAQAMRNARWLANFLSKATGERVTVQPIVALPGWYVTLKINSDVKVLSGKQVPTFISTQPTRLSDKTIQQISYQLEQRCRDVEV